MVRNLKRGLLIFIIGACCVSAWSQNKPKGNTTLSVSQDYISIPYAGGEYRFTVSSNQGYKVSSSYSWLQVYNYGDYIRVVCSENTSNNIRYGSILVQTINQAKSLTVSVNQQGKPANSLSISPQSITVEAKGGRQSLYVSTDAASWNISDLPYWCTSESKTANGIILLFAENTSSSVRSANITINAGSEHRAIFLYQKANEEFFICSPSSMDFDARGGNSTLSVKINGNTSDWTYESPSWIKMTWNTYSGSFLVSCSSNTSSSSRSGYIKLIARDKGKTKYIPVSQKGGSASSSSSANSKKYGFNDFWVDKQLFYVNAEGGYYRLGIYGSNYVRLGKIWTNKNWLEEENLGEGGNQFHVKKNNSSTQRQGELYITDTNGRKITVTVIQYGK